MDGRMETGGDCRISWWQYLPEEPIQQPEITVYSADPSPTGLLDPYGNPIVKHPNSIGFLTRTNQADMASLQYQDSERGTGQRRV